jgi:hypothetical protein
LNAFFIRKNWFAEEECMPINAVLPELLHEKPEPKTSFEASMLT